MDLCIVLLILHVLWMLIWSMYLPQQSLLPQRQARIQLQCHHYYRNPVNWVHQQPKHLSKTMTHNYNEKDSTQSNEIRLENMVVISNDTVTTRSADKLNNFICRLRHILKVLLYTQKLKCTRLVISIHKNVWKTFIVVWKLRTESEQNNQLVLHLHNSVDKYVSKHLKSKSRVEKVYHDILRTQRNNNKLL